MKPPQEKRPLLDGVIPSKRMEFYTGLFQMTCMSGHIYARYFGSEQACVGCYTSEVEAGHIDPTALRISRHVVQLTRAIKRERCDLCKIELLRERPATRCRDCIEVYLDHKEKLERGEEILLSQRTRYLRPF